MLELASIKIGVGERCLLTFERLNISQGQIVTLLGPSGTGKSTFLKSIAGLSDREVSFVGSIYFNNDRIDHLPAYRRNFGYVDQRPVLFPHLNVWQNLAFGLRGGTKDDVSQALETADLVDLAMADVATLSGGQAARVALMRTLLAQPRVLLLDEPFAALDPELRRTMRDFVFERVQDHNVPTLLVTHDAEDAKTAGGPMFTLKNQTLMDQ